VNPPFRQLSVFNLPWPTDWSAVFGSHQPLIIEIGFGLGHYLHYLSRTYPQSNILGLEVANMCLVKAETAIQRGDLPNVRVLYGYAETALRHLIEPDTLSAVYINFPDPWFKLKHRQRRLIQRDTVDALVSRMQPRARLYLATDIFEYAHMSDQVFRATPGLTNTLDAPYVHSLPDRVTTKYEAKAIREGRRCYYFVYERNRQPAPLIPIVQESLMPHIIFTSPLSFQEIATRFTPFDHHHQTLHTHVHNAYYNDQGVLFDVFVSEPTIEQRIAILLVRREDHSDQYVLRLGTIGMPRPTEGVHLAVRGISTWILGLHPDSVIIEDKLREEFL
jgi:tRNA (guanine-N7-)-methyltransferase